MPTALLIHPAIKLTDLRVYGLLASHKDQAGQSWISSYSMAQVLGVARPNVARALRKLRDHGFIKKLNRGGGPKNASLYLIVDPSKCIMWDTVNADDSEAKNFAGKGITGDNPRVSHEIPKYNPKGYTPPLPPPAGGDAAAPNGATLGHSLDAACGGAHAENAAPNGATLVDGGACGADQSGGGEQEEKFSDAFPTENVSAAYARERIADAIGYQNGAASILMSADDPTDPNHIAAARTVQNTADRIGVRWAGPRHA